MAMSTPPPSPEPPTPPLPSPPFLTFSDLPPSPDLSTEHLPLLQPSPTTTTTTTATRPLRSQSPPPPPIPPAWTWTCHLCGTKYPIGATRRCLVDGHVFCNGTSPSKNTTTTTTSSGRRLKRHRPCASEFDYAGWQARGQWRRDAHCMVALSSASRCSGGDENTAGDNDNGSGSGNGNGNTSPPQQPLLTLSPPNEDPQPPKQQQQQQQQQHSCALSCDFPSQCRWTKILGHERAMAMIYGAAASVAAVAAGPDVAELEAPRSSSSSSISSAGVAGGGSGGGGSRTKRGKPARPRRPEGEVVLVPPFVPSVVDVDVDVDVGGVVEMEVAEEVEVEGKVEDKEKEEETGPGSLVSPARHGGLLRRLNAALGKKMSPVKDAFRSVAAVAASDELSDGSSGSMATSRFLRSRKSGEADMKPSEKRLWHGLDGEKGGAVNIEELDMGEAYEWDWATGCARRIETVGEVDFSGALYD